MAPTVHDEPRRHVLALTGLAVAIGIAYASSFRAGFLFDSRAIIVENPRIQRATLANLRLIVTEDYWQPHAVDGLYRPLTTLSYLFNYAVLGNADRPFGYHAVNLLLHLGCVALLYALVWQLVGRVWPALVGALLFGLHPVTTEAVTNVVGRADLLAAFGVLLALLCHACGADEERGLWCAGVAVGGTIAFFSKESGLALVPILLAYDVAVRGRVQVRDHVVVGALLGLYLAVRWWVAAHGLPGEDLSPIDNPMVEASVPARVVTAIKVLGRYLWLLLVPITLSADYSYRAIPVAGWPPGLDGRALLGLTALGLLTGTVVRLRRDVPAAVFLVLCFAATLLPVSNLLLPIGSIMAERFLYLPLAAFAGALALLAEHAASRRRLVTAAVVVVALLFGWRTALRNGDWIDERALWSSAVAAEPDSAKAHKALAVALLGARAPIDRVLEEGERAVDIRPDYMPALVDLGSYYLLKGDLVAREQGPATARAWFEKSVAVLERGRTLDQASTRRFVEKMLARGNARDAIPEVGNGELYQNLSLAYVQAERLEDALGAYEQSRRLRPSNPTHYVDLSAVLARLGRWEEAAVALFEAVAIDPGNRDASMRLVELYRTFYPEGRAIGSDDPTHVVINLDDPAVRNHRCRAYDGLTRIFTDARRLEDAAKFRALAAQHCRRGA